MLKRVLGALFLFCVIQIGFVMAEEIQIDLGNGVKMELVYIPAGEFMMGSAESAEETAKKFGRDPAKFAKYFQPEHPQHKVKITNGFYMGKYEVTQEQYQAVMGNNPSNFKGDKNPVDQVSWNDCQEFCHKVSEKIKETVRLPREAEWGDERGTSMKL